MTMQDLSDSEPIFDKLVEIQQSLRITKTHGTPLHPSAYDPTMPRDDMSNPPNPNPYDPVLAADEQGIVHVYRNPLNYGVLMGDYEIANIWRSTGKFTQGRYVEVWRLNFLLRIGSAFDGDSRSILWGEARAFRDALFKEFAKPGNLNLGGEITKDFEVGKCYVVEDPDPRIPAYGFTLGPGAIGLMTECGGVKHIDYRRGA